MAATCSPTACYIRFDITLSFLFILLVLVVIFSASSVNSVHHLLPPVRKCSNVTDQYELPDFWLPNSSDKNKFHYKIWGSESTRKKVQDVNDLRQHLIDV